MYRYNLLSALAILGLIATSVAPITAGANEVSCLIDGLTSDKKCYVLGVAPCTDDSDDNSTSNNSSSDEGGPGSNAVGDVLVEVAVLEDDRASCD